MLNRNNAIVLLLIALWLGTWAVETDRVKLPWVSTKIDRVTYVYEKDDGAVPPAVSVAFMELNGIGEVIASEFEDDTVDGDGQVPDQYLVASQSANKSTTPCIVAQSGNVAVRTVPIDPVMPFNELKDVVLEASK